MASRAFRDFLHWSTGNGRPIRLQSPYVVRQRCKLVRVTLEDLVQLATHRMRGANGHDVPATALNLPVATVDAEVSHVIHYAGKIDLDSVIIAAARAYR